jgi:DNA-binding NarL/FixJ family response regulator
MEGNMGVPSIVLADDQPEVLDRARQLLEPKFNLLASVENGQQAIWAVSTLDPDLLVLDISMPVLNGIRTASHLKKTGCRTKVIFLTIHQDPDFLAAAFSVGALGYVLKYYLATDLLPAIREVLQGHIFISPAMCTTWDFSAEPTFQARLVKSNNKQ